MSSEPRPEPARPKGDDADARRGFSIWAIFFVFGGLSYVLIVGGHWVVWSLIGVHAVGLGWFLLVERPGVGPLFFYELVRLARRGRGTVLRVLYLAVLLAVLWRVHQSWQSQWSIARDAGAVHPAVTLNQAAGFAERFIYNLLIVQNLAVFLLTPIYVASALTEERERRTLDLLFTTHLSDWEIVLGKLFARLGFLGAVLLAGFPVLALLQLWGGIDMAVLAANFTLTAVNMLAVGGLCIWISATTPTMTQSILCSYAVMIPGMFCLSCGSWAGISPFLIRPDMLANSSGAVTVYEAMFASVARMGLIGVGLGTICTFLGVFSLRDMEGQKFAPRPTKPPPVPAPGSVKLPEMEPARPPLPPVTDQPLLWKELHAGGEVWTRSPMVLGPSFLLFLPYVVVLVVWYGINWFFAIEPKAREDLIQVWLNITRLMVIMVSALGCVAAGFFAAGSVAREREQRTLDSLLTLPVSRRDILNAKWIAAIVRGHGWLYLVAVFCFAEVLMTGSLARQVLRLSVPFLHLLFVVSLGIFLSVFSRTMQRAYIAMAVLLGLLVLAPHLMEFLLNYRYESQSVAPLRALSPPHLWVALAFADETHGMHWTVDVVTPGLLTSILAIHLLTAFTLWTIARWRWDRE